MKYRYLSIFLILMILSIGAVSAQENAATDGNVPNVQGNVSSEVVITDNNYNNYFNSTTGKILENSGISDGSTIKIGNVTNKIFSIDKNLTIMPESSSDVLTNVSFYFVKGSDNSIIQNLNFKNNGDFTAINVTYAENITVFSNEITVVSLENSGDVMAIYAKFADNLAIAQSTITYTGKTNGTGTNNAVRVLNSEGVSIYSSVFEINLPGGDFNWTAGFGSTEGIVMDNCGHSGFEDNNLTVSASNAVGVYPTVYAVHMTRSDLSYIHGNRLSVSGDIDYIYGFKVGGNEFYLSQNSIIVENTNYFACGVEVDGSTTGSVLGNTIIASSKAASYGVYSGFGDNVVNYTGNLISCSANGVFAMELFGSEAVVLGNEITAYGNYTVGIASKITGNLAVLNNEIAVNGLKKDIADVGDWEFNETTTVGIYAKTNIQIQNCVITSTGNYSVINFGNNSKVTNNYLVSNELLGDESVNDTSASAIVKDNVPIKGATNYDLNDGNFSLFFDDNGRLRENITSESLTFHGLFSEFGVDSNFVIDRPIKLLSDNATLSGFPLQISSDNVTVDGFNFNVSMGDAGGLYIIDSKNVSIINNKFNVEGDSDGSNFAIYISESDDVLIDNNTIEFSVVTDETFYNKVIAAQNSNNLVISNNTITAEIPARSIDWSTGEAYSEGICLNDCNDAVFADNFVSVKSSGQISTYDTIYAVHITGNNTNVSGNTIALDDAPYGYGLVISGENFTVENNIPLLVKCNDYSCGIEVDGTASGVISGNEIVTVGEASYGIYTSNWAGDVEVDITDNMIISNGTSVFGMSLSGSKAFVNDTCVIANGNFTTGIASAFDNITISNCVIESKGSNVGTPTGYDMMGIKTSGIRTVSGEAIVTNNNVTSNSRYAVEIAEKGKVTDNELHAELLTGDFAVNYTQGEAIVANNTPAMVLNYTLTNETFYVYFDEEGKLREQIKADNLTFIGEFSNLVSKIIIDEPITLLADNATLCDMGIEIHFDNVTVDGFSFDSNMLSEIILIEQANDVSIINNKFAVVGLKDDDNYVIHVSESARTLINNNQIAFEVVSNGTHITKVIFADDCDNINVSKTYMGALLPARPIDWTTGEVYSEGICLKDCDGAVLENNDIGLGSNNKTSTYDTIYIVHISGDNVTVSKNALALLNAPYGYGIVLSGENFTIEGNAIAISMNSDYSCGIEVDGEANGVINKNAIKVIGTSAYGIYTADWAGDVKANITNNSLKVKASSAFGMSLSGSEILVKHNEITMVGNYTTGIASAASKIAIVNNTISQNASNEGPKIGYDTMGIETTGVHIVSGQANVAANYVNTTGDFAVDLNANAGAIVTGNYLVSKDLTGDASVNYVPSQTIFVMYNVPAMEKVFISADNIVMYYKNGTKYVVTLTDSSGNFLANKTVTITINGQNYTRTTNENGTASMAINLNSGNYTVAALYAGESGLGKASVENNITILSTVYGDDLVKVFRNASQYYATFLDGQGNPLAEGNNVTFNINGVMYIRKTNANGIAKLNINLQQGTYIITAINPNNGEMHANNVTVLSTITNNSDLVKYYRNASQYVVTIIGEDGKVVGAGENVTFNINGVMYTRTTNATGQAKLNINLDPGNYTITAEYKKCKVSNNIEVKPVLSAEDVTIKQGTSGQFRAKLLDGQGKPYAGQNLTFNINGIFYNRTTDADGYAALTIRLTAAVNTYIITSSYNGTNVANKISIIP